MTIAQMSGVCINNNFQNPHRPFASSSRSQINELSNGSRLGLDSCHDYNSITLKSECDDNYDSNDHGNNVWNGGGISPRLQVKESGWREIDFNKQKGPGEKSKVKGDYRTNDRNRRKSSMSIEVNNLKIDRCTTPQLPNSESVQPDYTRHLYMPPEHINGNGVGRHLSGSHTNNNSLDYSHKNKNFWDDYRQHEYQRYHHHHQDQQQARVPWNLAGLVGHIPSESGSGHNHYPAHYPSPTPSSHLLGHPVSSSEQSSLWAMGMHPHLSTPGVGIDLTGSDPVGFSYKGITDQMSMYYASQVSSGGGPGSGTVNNASLNDLPTTTSNSTSTISTETLVNSFQALSSIESGEGMQPLQSYFGQTDMAVGEDHGNWMDSGHSAAAAVVAAVAANHPHHHGIVDSYPEYPIPRIGNSYTNRKKNLIKEWTKTNTSGGASSSGNARSEHTNNNGEATPLTSRSFLGNDFVYPPSSSVSSYNPLGIPSKDDTNGLRDYTPYGLHPYAAYSDLVHPYSHHHPVLGHHTGQHLHAQQMAMSLGGVPAGLGHQSHGEHLPHHPMLTRRERKRKSEQKPLVSTTPVSIGGLSRDERKALSVGEAFTGLPLSVQDIIQLPMDEFNDLLSKHELTEEQLSLCRDIRRRGKNKVAARNCRRRKIDQIKQLEDDVARIRCRKTELINEFEKLSAQRIHWSDMVRRLHDFVLQELGHDPNQYQIQLDHNRQIHILPRNQKEETALAKSEQPYHYAPHLGPTVMTTMAQQRP